MPTPGLQLNAPSLGRDSMEMGGHCGTAFLVDMPTSSFSEGFGALLDS